MNLHDINVTPLHSLVINNPSSPILSSHSHLTHDPPSSSSNSPTPPNPLLPHTAASLLDDFNLTPNLTSHFPIPVTHVGLAPSPFVLTNSVIPDSPIHSSSWSFHIDENSLNQFNVNATSDIDTSDTSDSSGISDHINIVNSGTVNDDHNSNYDQLVEAWMNNVASPIIPPIDVSIINDPIPLVYEINWDSESWATDQATIPGDEYDRVNSVDEVSRIAYLSGTDIQGIDWTPLPFTRETYRQSRNKEYTSYRNTNTPLSMLQREYTRLAITHCLYQFSYTKLSTKLSFTHFQLRNLIWAPTKNDIVYTHDSAVKLWDVQKRTSRTLVDCFSDIRATPRGPVRLSSIAAAHNMMVAGGYMGEYIIKPLNNRLPPVSGILTHDTNGISNQIEIVPDISGTLCALVASNDSMVRRLILERQTVSQTFSLPWAVNTVVQSPDRRMLAVVGDATETRLLDAADGQEIAQVHGHIDYSFAAAWSPDGTLLATGNQDRTARIYDRRYLTRALIVLPSVMGAIRSLRFAADGTLAIAEDVDYVHIVTPRLDAIQSIDFFGEIAGIAFTPDNHSPALYIGNADERYGSILEFTQTHPNGIMAVSRGGAISGYGEDEISEDLSVMTRNRTFCSSSSTLMMTGSFRSDLIGPLDI